MEDEVYYVIDFDGERPKGKLVDATQAMVDELDAAQPEVFETLRPLCFGYPSKRPEL